MSQVHSTRASVAAIVIVAVASFVAGSRFSGDVAAAPAMETVSLAAGTSVAISTPPFIQAGKRYAFSWPGGGPQQTHTIKSVRPDGWVEVQVAEGRLGRDACRDGGLASALVDGYAALFIGEID